MEHTWDTVRRLVAWLDAESAAMSPEVAEAIHGVMGGNPRKGASHTWAAGRWGEAAAGRLWHPFG
ncbi:hypothetical protein ACWDSL_44305 [Streptomyces sp. NPDC000941]